MLQTLTVPFPCRDTYHMYLPRITLKLHPLSTLDALNTLNTGHTALCRAVMSGSWLLIEDADRAPADTLALLEPLARGGSLNVPSLGGRYCPRHCTGGQVLYYTWYWGGRYCTTHQTFRYLGQWVVKLNIPDTILLTFWFVIQF